jgi:hypothetical protein
MTTSKFCALVVLILSLAMAAFGQSQATTGNIQGRVLDPKEAAVNNTCFSFSTAGGGTLTPPNFLTAFGTPRSFSSPASGTTTFVTPRELQLAIKFDF